MTSVEDFVDQNSRALLRSAWLLTGNWASAEDLVQTSLLQSWLHWDAIESDAPDFYVRRVLINTFLTGQRRRWTRERPTAQLPDRAAADELNSTELRHVIWGALSALPAKQRAVVVLRYFNDLTEAQTARVLDCSVGTVKSQASRALARLRSVPELQSLLEEVGHE
ncbi:MAG: SigE family RNA polymerase sigma factor [Dermatophilaceae bacterium]